jgi:PiT family inorganic phosphate transporter
MVLLMSGYLEQTGEFVVPFWVITACALAMGLGTATGGWSIIKTVGTGIYRLRPIHGFSAQLTSASVILAAAHFGFPVSTTHIASSSIMGVGSSERIKAVKWLKAGEIAVTWFLTIPAAAIVSALTFWALQLARKLI